MSKEVFLKSINDAIAAHGVWKVDLDKAISTGASHRKVDDSKKDDQCAFGKWLKTVEPNMRGGEFQKVMEFHTRFHKEAAHVLELALAGKRDEATAALDILGPFSSTSGALTRAMVEWRRHVG